MLVSTRMAGSPTPLPRELGSVESRSMMRRMGLQVVPWLVLRMVPTSMSAGRSPEFLWRMSNTAMRVPLAVVARPGMR